MADATSALRLADITRFWCPPSADYAVDAGGFLTDPEAQGFGGGSRNPNAVPTGSLAAHRCAVLLGEPGIGKSRVLAGTGALAGVVDDVVRIDLAGYGSESRLIREVFEHPDITRWSAGDGSLALVLDSFDEAQRRVPTLGSIARAYVTGYPCERLYLRIACRTAEWPRTLARFGRQIVMLVRQHIPAAQDEVFETAWHIRHVQQRPEVVHHGGPLGLIAVFARGDAVCPAILAAVGARQHVVARQMLARKNVATVGAGMSVAREQQVVIVAQRQRHAQFLVMRSLPEMEMIGLTVIVDSTPAFDTPPRNRNSRSPSSHATLPTA